MKTSETNSPVDLSAARRLDQACNRFEAAWREGRPRIDDFLAGAGDVSAVLLRELILLDVHYRQQAGESPCAEDYQAYLGTSDADWLAEVLAGLSVRPTIPALPAGATGAFAAPPDESPTALFHPRPFGNYVLLGKLGEGGMGVVYKAWQVGPKRIVALKMIRAGGHAGEDDLTRFCTEGEAIARLQHPNIVAIYEVGRHEGKPFFSLEHCSGGSLDRKLAGTPIEPKDAAKLVRTLADAMHAAHQANVIHRDLKPANVLLTADGTPKITDFGLAKMLDESGPTKPNAIMGTLSYMAPEQAECRKEDIGPLADVYALGAILYECLTGRPPFKAATDLGTILQVVADEPAPVRQLNRQVPRDLETICLTCLQKSPGKRYASAAALAEDLDRYLNDCPIQKRPAGMVEKAYRWYRRRPVIGTMAAALAMLLVAVPVLLAGLWQAADKRANLEADGHKKEAEAHKKEAEARRKIEALERARTRQLFQAYVNEAAARRTSPRVGRRFEALDRIRAARNLADQLKLPTEDYVRLRSEAISALSLTDLRGTTTGPGWAFRGYPDPRLLRHASGKDCYLDWDKPRGLFVRRIGDNSIVQRIPDIKRDPTFNDWPKISPDNRFVSILSSGKLVVWQVDGTTPKEIARHEKVHFVTFAPDRPEVVLLTAAHEIVILPLEGEGKSKTLRIPEIQKEPLQPGHQSLASAGRRVAVAGANRVSIVDVDAGKVTAVCSLPDLVNPLDVSLAWSPDGATLAVACREGSIVFYQPANQSRRVVKGPDASALWVTFDPTGRYLLSTGLWAGRGILWDVANARAALRFSLTELVTKGPAYAGPQLLGWWQGALDPPHRFITSFLPEDGLFGTHAACALHPKGRLLVTNHTTTGIVLGDLATGQRVGFLPAEKGTGNLFDSAGNLYGYINQQPHRWAITTEGNCFKIGQPERLNLPVMYWNKDNISADGRFIAQAMGNAGSIVFDRQTGKTTPLQPQLDVRHVAVHPDGSLVASFSWNAKGFRLWKSATGKLIHAHDEENCWRGKFTPDGKYLITTANEIPDIQLWSVPDCKRVRKFGPRAEFAISPDSRYIAAAEATGKVRLNRIDNGELIAHFDAPGDDYLADINFSPDGHYLFGLNLERNKYHVWDLWKLRRQLRELKLDWETTPVPEAAAVRAPIVVEIAGQK